MFTGIVTDLGRIRAIEPRGDSYFAIETAFETASLDIGASVACSGACLTVVDKGPDWFGVLASAETLSKTTLGAWQVGTPINLERALKVGDELGGHIVSGHVDGVAKVLERRPEGDSQRFVFEAPEELSRFIASKGSVTLDGVSLTVNEVEARRFGVNIIPHTASVTTFGRLAPGDAVNLEIDMLARYVQRLLQEGQ
ncbi:MAG: riboflavin synthase [Kiloniellales bacterium]|nr:riboflavin synthase [Kiloniellales bacterium]